MARSGCSGSGGGLVTVAADHVVVVFVAVVTKITGVTDVMLVTAATSLFGNFITLSEVVQVVIITAVSLCNGSCIVGFHQ